jgi:hypothetical protein
LKPFEIEEEEHVLRPSVSPFHLVEAGQHRAPVGQSGQRIEQSQSRAACASPKSTLIRRLRIFPLLVQPAQDESGQTDRQKAR